MKENNFDQFYTNPLTAKKLTSIFTEEVKKLDYQKINFLEPSAGTGNFLEAIREISKNNSFISKKVLAFDIEPKSNKDLQLIYDINLEPNSFLANDKVYFLNSCFQIWTKRKTEQKDLRIKERPITKHPDFEMFLHNNTLPTLKYFQKDKYNWDFAVVRQGFYDYNQKIETEKQLFKNRQYIFFKSKNELTKQRLLQLDFTKLAQKNTITPGFGKHDVVVAYNDLC